MQAKGELFNDVILLAIFIYLILVLNRKVKLRRDIQEKLNGLLSRSGTPLKILVYGGALIFMSLILIRIFDPA